MTSNQNLHTYRPHIWQSQQWQTFLGLLSKGKLPHALLMSGPAETGKQHFAMALASRMLCQSPVDDQACQRCKGCQLVHSGAHPDFLPLKPEAKGKSISVDAIRELASFSARTAMFGGWRIMLISPVETLTHNAANALLKTLEEPGSDTLLMLIYHQQSELLATIRSRCQRMLFPVPRTGLALEWLRGEVEAENYEAVLETASGRPLRARRLIDDGLLEQVRQIEEMLADVAEGRLSPVLAAEQWKATPAIDFVDCLLAIQTKTISNKVKKNILPVKGYFIFMDQLLQTKKLLLSKANPNPQLLIEELLSGWRQLGSVAR